VSVPCPLAALHRPVPTSATSVLSRSVCPAHFGRPLAPARHPVTALKLLQDLTSLEVRGADYHPARKGFMQLTRLKALRMRSVADLQPDDVAGLTQLRQLTVLECRHLSHSCYSHSVGNITDGGCQLAPSGLLCLHNQVRQKKERITMWKGTPLWKGVPAARRNYFFCTLWQRCGLCHRSVSHTVTQEVLEGGKCAHVTWNHLCTG
jgi:hypothetical protein